MLFAIEKGLAEKNATSEERYKERLEQAKPVLDAMFAWANSRNIAPKSAQGKVLHYLKEQWSYLTGYLKDGRMELSKNRVERSIMTTVSYQTDAMGNPIRISDGGVVKTLSWGEGRMLLEVRTNAFNYSQYTYNTDGLRTKKIVAVNGIKTTTEYAWGDNGLAGTIIRDGTATTTVVPHYDIEGEAIGFTVKRVPSRLSSPSTTNTYTYVKNLQGDVLRILDCNGNAVVNYTYDPWGKPTVTGDEELAALNPCSYRGYDYNEETGYYSL